MRVPTFPIMKNHISKYRQLTQIKYLKAVQFFPCNILGVAGICGQRSKLRELPEGFEAGVHQEVQARVANLGNPVRRCEAWARPN
jgi:hypothetical protein